MVTADPRMMKLKQYGTRPLESTNCHACGKPIWQGEEAALDPALNVWLCFGCFYSLLAASRVKK